MEKAEDLFEQADKATKFRGHIMHNFVRLVPASGRAFYRSTCAVCGKTVDVRTRPAANQAEMAGDALALNCRK